jgi:hypothetical protein
MYILITAAQLNAGTIQQKVILHKLQYWQSHLDTAAAQDAPVMSSLHSLNTTDMQVGPQIMIHSLQIQEPVWSELDHMLQLLHLRWQHTLNHKPQTTPLLTLQHLSISPHSLPTYLTLHTAAATYTEMLRWHLWHNTQLNPAKFNCTQVIPYITLCTLWLRAWSEGITGRTCPLV